jgi:hypothetical protein
LVRAVLLVLVGLKGDEGGLVAQFVQFLYEGLAPRILFERVQKAERFRSAVLHLLLTKFPKIGKAAQQLVVLRLGLELGGD